MSDIKFLCPSCSQRIQCDEAHAGMRIPCPGCRVELEIPQVQPQGSPVSGLPKAGLAAGAGSAPAGSDSTRGEPSRAEPVLAESSSQSRGEGRQGSDVSRGDSAGEGGLQEVRYLCPCCRSELKIKLGGKPGVATGTLPFAELVRPGAPDHLPTPVPPAEKEGAKTEPSWRWAETPPAASTAERSSGPRVGMKPRLSYVLTGQPPAPPPKPDGTPRRKGKKGAEGMDRSKEEEGTTAATGA